MEQQPRLTSVFEQQPRLYSVFKQPQLRLNRQLFVIKQQLRLIAFGNEQRLFGQLFALALEQHSFAF